MFSLPRFSFFWTPVRLNTRDRLPGRSRNSTMRPFLPPGNLIKRQKVRRPNCGDPSSGLMSKGTGELEMIKVLKGGRLIDGTGAGPVAGATVVIRDQRIETV